jgi:dienelactone hydrolase
VAVPSARAGSTGGRLRRAGAGLTFGALLVLAGCPADTVPGAHRSPVTTSTSRPAESSAPAPAPSPESPTSTVVPPARPLEVASLTLSLVDDSRPTVSSYRTVSASRALTTLVWYPATGGPWPLVVFAHGFEVGPEPYAALCRAWAAAGYVVAAPEFPLTDVAVAGDDLDESDIGNQPGDVRFVFESLDGPASPLAGRVDADRLAVAGHSDGGVTALAVTADPPPGLRATIALSASPVEPGAGAPVPLLVAQGDEDPVNPWEVGASVYDQASPPRFLLTLLGAGHLPPFTEGSPWHGMVNRVTVDFLDHYVAGRTTSTSAAALADDVDPRLATLDADP